MTRALTRKLVVLWVLLVVITLASWETSVLGGAAGQSWAIAGIMALAFIKVRIVIIHFMEVGDAPAWLRIGLEAWVIVVGAVLTVWLITGS